MDEKLKNLLEDVLNMEREETYGNRSTNSQREEKIFKKVDDTISACLEDDDATQQD